MMVHCRQVSNEQLAEEHEEEEEEDELVAEDHPEAQVTTPSC